MLSPHKGLACLVLLLSLQIARSQLATILDDDGDNVVVTVDADGDTSTISTIGEAATTTTTSTSRTRTAQGVGGVGGVAGTIPTGVAPPTVYAGADGASHTYTPTFSGTATPAAVPAGTIAQYSAISASIQSARGSNSGPIPASSTLGMPSSSTSLSLYPCSVIITLLCMVAVFCLP